MRRLSFIALILLVGRGRRRRTRWTRAGRRRRRRHNRPPPRARAPTTSRSLFALTDRELFIGGRATSIDGDPARFQRYQDVRDGLALLRLPLLVRAARRQLHLQGAREQRRLARSGVLRQLQPRREAVGHRRLPADSAVLQRGHDDALYGQRRHAGARRCGAARRPERSRPQPLRPDRAAVRAARAARHRARRCRRHADAEARRHGQLHHAEARRRAAVGRELRLQQRRRGAAALRSRANDFTIGTEWTNTKNMLRVAYSGSWFDNSRRRSPGTVRCASTTRRARRDTAACRCGRPTPRRRSASAATPSWRTRRRSPVSSPTACGATTSRCSRSRSIRRCRRSRCPAPPRMPKRTCSRPT